jgi:hypothetical protein
MDMKEFESTAKRTEDSSTITWDVRPFGNRQAEAIESYLQGRLMNLQMGAGGFGPRTVVLLCDSATQLSVTGSSWLATLNAKGVPTEILTV